MMNIRRADDRGAVNLGWLMSQHTFSFGQYYDRTHMGFGSLRVINEDRVAPVKASIRTVITTWRSSPTSSTARWRTGTA